MRSRARLLGTSLAVRDVGLLGSAVARPQTTVGGADAYPDVWTKAAALLQSIVDSGEGGSVPEPITSPVGGYSW